MTVSDITRSKYECIIQSVGGTIAHRTGSGAFGLIQLTPQIAWAYICKRKDSRVALVIYYNHEANVLMPPIMHQSCSLEDADTSDICQFLQTPCHADPWGFMNQDKFRAAHQHQIEPPPAFWDAMIQVIEIRRIPEEPTHEAL